MIKLQRFIRSDSAPWSPIGEGYEYEWQTIALVLNYRSAFIKVKLLDKEYGYRVKYSDTEIVSVGYYNN